jgi:hypothetical protein
MRRMGTRRGARALLMLAILAASVAETSTASAQQPDVRLRLIDQTPWTTPDRPRLTIVFEATNAGTQTVGDLSAGLTLGPAVRARLVYEQTLTNGPGAFPIYAATVPQTGELAPGATRRFSVVVDVSAVGDVSTVDSLVYPAQVGLLSAGAPVATANTAEINFVRTPEKPLVLSWWAEVAAPVAMAPSGLLADAGFETAIAHGGGLRSEAASLRRLATHVRSAAIHIAVEPAVVEQLSRMADGYQRTFGAPVPRNEGGAADASALLTDLQIAGSGRQTDVSAMPFSAPRLPSLVTNGLARELDRQRTLADETVTKRLDTAADPQVVRPPGGALDDAAVQALAARGVTTLLGDANTVVRPPQPNDFAPPPTAVLPTRGTGGMSVVLPDPSVAALLGNGALLSDPVRAAQAILGEIATIWREEPVPIPPNVRGIAVGLPASLPAGIWSPLVQRLGTAPFLRTVQPSTLVASVIPAGSPASLSTPSPAGFSRPYAAQLRAARTGVASYRSMLTGSSPFPDRLDRNLLYAEAGQYVGDETAGRSWLDQVQAFLGGVFARAAPDTRQTFTFTSHDGTIPIRMGDPGSTPLRVVIQLQSSRFSFPGGDSHTVTLSRPNQIVEFRVAATVSGQGAIQVIVHAPSGLVIDQATLLVRSTAVSRIALIITAAAALVLAALWSRRLFRRPSR